MTACLAVIRFYGKKLINAGTVCNAAAERGAQCRRSTLLSHSKVIFDLGLMQPMPITFTAFIIS